MKTLTSMSLAMFTCLAAAANCNVTTAADNPIYVMSTSAGDISIELFADKAPISTKNFIEYAESGYFKGTIFHRVIPDFMIQGGGFTADMKKKRTKNPIKNESKNGLKNEKYTLAMARTSSPDSATSQFFINVKDNDMLNRDNPRSDGYGYAVFGKVVAGEEVVEKIRTGKTKSLFSLRMDDVPVEPVVIEKVVLRKKDTKKESTDK